jgi:hypothetical protein
MLAPEGCSRMAATRASKTVELSWEPVRRGEVYCSPACGCGCTWEAYQEILQKAENLAKRMGKGWTPRVWENMGWYGKVVSPDGFLKLHIRSAVVGRDSYTAFLGEDESGGRWAESHTVPEQAVKLVRKRGMEELRIIAKLLGYEVRN